MRNEVVGIFTLVDILGKCKNVPAIGSMKTLCFDAAPSGVHNQAASVGLQEVF